MFDIKFSSNSNDFNIGFKDKKAGTEFKMGFDEAKEIIVKKSIPLPDGGNPGDFLCRANSEAVNLAWTPLATKAEENNNAPISSAAVYTEIGNINVLLATI